ncbi:hypothetical protein OIV83_006219 [Microbotryomycetes sp. JL201]|nr:hypothetical protein OIV83_006219 [Microbotryomycetes sp. JL201]
MSQKVAECGLALKNQVKVYCERLDWSDDIAKALRDAFISALPPKAQEDGKYTCRALEIPQRGGATTKA